MSSHQFEEIERTCDRAGIIRDGRLVTIEDITNLKQTRQRKYTVILGSEAELPALKQAGLAFDELGRNTIELTVTGRADPVIKQLAAVTVESLETGALSLEEIFMQYYGQEVQA
jgi:ABC-2 type transport system ATP-binding protein